MRYTMRKRNVHWADHPAIRAAVEWLEELLHSDCPQIFRGTIQAGWDLVSNNVLHDRSGFEDDTQAGRQRLLYRARYHDRIAGI